MSLNALLGAYLPGVMCALLFHGSHSWNMFLLVSNAKGELLLFYMSSPDGLTPIPDFVLTLKRNSVLPPEV